MNLFFWRRVYERLANNTMVHNDPYKDKICQVVREDNESAKYVEDCGNFFLIIKN